jgi:Domain of unknown function (DUF4145)
MTDLKFIKRFTDLDAEFKKIHFRRTNEFISNNENGEWRTWATSSENLISASFGMDSVHAKNFSGRHQSCDSQERNIRNLYAVFLSAKKDYEGGHVYNIELTISGEIFGDFVSLARQSLSEGYKDVAAVLAAAALEDSLKRFAKLNDLLIEDATMQNVINALKAKGLIGGAQKTIVEAMPKIRNLALHAEWDKITTSEVGSMLGFVEQFLLAKFTPP